MNESVPHSDWQPRQLRYAGATCARVCLSVKAVEATLIRARSDRLGLAVGPEAAQRIHAGEPTVTDLIVGAMWLGVNPVTMWEQPGEDSRPRCLAVRVPQSWS